MLSGCFYDNWKAYQGIWIKNPNKPIGVDGRMLGKEEHESDEHACYAMRRHEQDVPSPPHELKPALHQHDKKAEEQECTTGYQR